MVNELDMYSNFKLNLSAVGLDTVKKVDKMQELSEKLYSKTLSIVSENENLISHLTSILISEYVLSLEEILDKIHDYHTSRKQM